MELFLLGMLAAGYAVAALFFLRFWSASRDRLFAIFAGAFLLLALTRVALAATGQTSESNTWVYWGRLLAYALILLAILDKNRPPRKGPAGRYEAAYRAVE